MAPRLAAFPKAYMDDLCVTGSMTLRGWIELASTLEIEGLEFYSGFIDLGDAGSATEHRRIAEDLGLTIPMLCCSPDFTHPDPKFRADQIDKQKAWIDLSAELGAGYCRTLTGQRRPDVSVADGIDYAVDSITACLAHAEAAGVTLILENHYKDNYWKFPEFAQHIERFCAVIERIDSPWFGVNYDPSNCLIAGEDPLDLLRRVRHRVVSMHASDRYCSDKSVTLEMLMAASEGYMSQLVHGEIGQGMNDYDTIFTLLREAGFDGWISIEDGVDGFDQLQRSVAFLNNRLAAHWPERVHAG